jgi:hypothetical protein
MITLEWSSFTETSISQRMPDLLGLNIFTSTWNGITFIVLTVHNIERCLKQRWQNHITEVICHVTILMY